MKYEITLIMKNSKGQETRKITKHFKSIVIATFVWFEVSGCLFDLVKKITDAAKAI